MNGWQQTSMEYLPMCGFPPFGWIARKDSGDHYVMVREQQLRACRICGRVLLNGPDAWSYCEHTQSSPT
jgi:hypothetical protein